MTTFDLMRLIIRDNCRKITPTQQLVLLHLVDRIDRSNTCWPSQDLIAAQTGFSTKCIGKAIKDLQKAGYLEILTSGKGRHHSSKYRITLFKEKPYEPTELAEENQNEVHLLAEENQNEVQLLAEENQNEVHLLAEENQNEVHLLAEENQNEVPIKLERGSIKPERSSHKDIQEGIQEVIKDNVGKPDYSKISSDVIEYLNVKTGKRFKAGKAHKKHITARLKEGHTFEDLVSVIDKKTLDWIDDLNMNQYLRPSTLFNSDKFEGYLNSPPKRQTSGLKTSREKITHAVMDICDTSW